MYTKMYRTNQSLPPAKLQPRRASAKVAVKEPVKCKRYGAKTKKESPRARDKRLVPTKLKEKKMKELGSLRTTATAVHAFLDLFDDVKAMKLKEEEEKNNPSFMATVASISAFLNILEDASEEEIKGDLHVESVDFQIPANTTEHFTDLFKSTKRLESPDLVLRRGYKFIIHIKLDRKYDRETHDLSFIFQIGDIAKRRTRAKFPMSEHRDDDVSHKTNWHAQLMSVKDDNVIVVEISIPPNVIIGHWTMSVVSFNMQKGEDVVIGLQYDSDMDIIILLNPWCVDDNTYLPTTSLLDEYVLNPRGAVYMGSFRQICAKPWRFGQFEEGILEICLSILRKAFNWNIGPEMSDPIQISRAISRIVNNCDDFGVLVGRWDDEYEDGRHPCSWSGSVKILKQFDQTGEPVRYGQCWVFSALVVTVCRALGLPCKSVTNYASAHDADGSVTIDSVFVKDEEGLMVPAPGYSSDSCWNFHVWNEVWMSRNDLPSGHDGWQVIDATPQETSEGKFACGPASVAAIRDGDCILPFDTRFVFSEVNADRIYWLLENGIWHKLNTVTYSVGKNISTKVPDGKPYKGSLFKPERSDETLSYKFMEGTKRERHAVMKANSSSTVIREIAVEAHDIEVNIKEIDDVMIGTDFNVKITVKNISESKETRHISKMPVDIYAMTYTGTIKGLVKKQSFLDIALDHGEEKELKIEVPYADYENKLVEQGGMEVKVLAIVKETQDAVVQKEDFRVRRPEVVIECATEGAELNSDIEIKMKLKNPLSVPFTNCSYTIDCECLGLDDEEAKVDDVPAKGEWTLTLKKKVSQVPTFGYDILCANFICKELADIPGSSDLFEIKM